MCLTTSMVMAHVVLCMLHLLTSVVYMYACTHSPVDAVLYVYCGCVCDCCPMECQGGQVLLQTILPCVLPADQRINASNGYQRYHSDNSGPHPSGNDATGMYVHMYVLYVCACVRTSTSQADSTCAMCDCTSVARCVSVTVAPPSTLPTSRVSWRPPLRLHKV